MSFYLVTYDLNAPGQKYDILIKKIQQIANGYCSPLKSTWIIGYNGTAQDVVNLLTPCIDKNDMLLVVKFTNNNYSGFLGQDDIAWLEKNIR